MSKFTIWALILIGLFLFFFGGIFSRQLTFGGFVLIAVGFSMGLGPRGILRKEQVVDTWAALIGNAQGRSHEIFQNTEIGIKSNKVPSLTMEKKSIAPGMIKGLLGKERDFLVVTNEKNQRLMPYKVFLNARDYGSNLDVSWYLTYQPSLWQSIASLIPFVNPIHDTLSELDVFDQQDLRAYVTVAHHSLLETVEKLMLAMQQDPSKLERKSKGFLGIS